MKTVTGTAAGVPFTALPPPGATDGSAPLIVTWHMLDAPRTDAAFAAALPMLGVPAWRVHLGLPMCGARMIDGRLDAHVELAEQDALRAYFAPVLHQAADEFPAALASLRDQLPLDDEPIGIVGGSLGYGPPSGSSRVSSGSRTRGPRSRAVPPRNWTSSAAPATSRRNRRCSWSAANGIIPSRGRTGPTWSVPYGSGTRTRTRSS